VALILDDCYRWQAGGCEWSTRYLWRSMSWPVRFDVIALALMLVYIFAIAIHVLRCFYLDQSARGIDSASRRKLAVDLSSKVGNLKAIASLAPYLGLVGTCLGILDAFVATAMEKHAFLVMTMTKIATALVTTAAGILVAVPATCSYNYLRRRIDSLETKALSEEVEQKGRQFRVDRRLALTKRFSQLPSFAVIATSSLAILVVGYMPFASFPAPKGFGIELASTHCEDGGNNRLIVLHITNAGKLFLNQEQEDWNGLGDRLSEIYSKREQRTLYLLADSSVSFQTVADALDIAENAPVAGDPQAVRMKTEKLNMTLRLITPVVMNMDCLSELAIDSSRHVSR
jgi:biopolymer transport protein ExbD